MVMVTDADIDTLITGEAMAMDFLTLITDMGVDTTAVATVVATVTDIVHFIN